MRTYLWVIVCVFSFLAGVGNGWYARSNSTNDRYINSLAERHEASAAFFNNRTDQLIRENERIYRNGKRN